MRWTRLSSSAGKTAAKTIVAIFGAVVSLVVLAVLYGSALADPTGSPAAPEPSEPSEPSEPAERQTGPMSQAEAMRAVAQDPECQFGLKVQMKVRGVTRIAKFDSELNVGPGLFDGMVCQGTDPEWLDLFGNLGLPPSDGYFVAFRFVPVTNTTAFEEDGQTKGRARLQLPFADVEMTSRLLIRVSDVKQDGVRIDVGRTCRTAKPAVIRLEGRIELTPGAESELRATYTIPKFTGCGRSEDLDPLLSGLVSGPGNELTVRLTSCGVGMDCPPDVAGK